MELRPADRATVIDARLAVNGRFLASRHPAGVHRAGRSLIDALSGVRDVAVIAPVPTDDPRVTRAIGPARGSVALQAWEQIVLPWEARRDRLLSLANTGPLVHHDHVLFVWDLSFRADPSWFAPRHNAYMRVMLVAARRAARVLVASRAVAEEVAAANIDESRISVVPAAVDSMFTPAAPGVVEAVRRRFGLPRRYLLHTGWADPRKDVGTAVAASTAVLSMVDHHLVLAGGGHPYFAAVPAPAAAHVKIVGRVDDHELVALMTGASALLYPSRYEGFGLPPLEAMACGTPVIASDIPVLRETAPGATFVRPADADTWAAASLAALSGELPTPSPPTRTWVDAARELNDLVS